MFNSYKKKINKASHKVNDTFTFENIFKGYFNLYSLIKQARSYNIRSGALKLPIYQNLTDPCILLIAYSFLKKKKASRVNDIPGENVTLAFILSLSLELRNKKFSPKPIRRIFIPKASGKMRPLGIPSIKDKIVQKAILIMLEPLFEIVFLDSSHGNRQNRSCHSALKSIYTKWRGIK